MALYNYQGNLASKDVTLKYAWSLGGISSSNGVCNASSSNRMKTVDYIPDSVTNVSVTSNYELGLFAYEKGSYVGCWGGSAFITTGITWMSEVDITIIKQVHPMYKFKVAVRLKTDANITLSEYTNVTFSLTDIELSDTDKAIVKSMNGLVDVYAAKRQRKDPTTTSNMYTNDMKQFATIVHTSDTHGDWERFERANIFADFIEADAFVNTGDIVWYYSADPSDYVEETVKAHNTDFHFCVGNHDAYNLSSEQAIYDKYIAPFASTYNWVTDSEVSYPTYYYKDLADRKLRIISVNQYQFSNQVGTTQVCYHQEQIDFICNALLNTPANYGVIILLHGVEKTPVLSSGYTKFKTDITRFNGVQSSPIYQIVDAFISGTSINMTIQNGSGATPSSYTINKNFSGKNSGVEFIAYLSGHLHTDNVYYVSEATNKQLMLNICCTNATFGRNKTYSTPTPGSNCDNPYSNEGNDLGREVGTPSEDAFNVYCIDRTNKLVKIVRIGSRLTFNLSVNRDYMAIPYAD